MATNTCLTKFCIFIRLISLMIVYIKFCFYESFRGKNVENISKKNQISQTGKKSQNPKKNCRDFLIPRIFVRSE
jgi:hypothetical protein